MIKAVLFDMDGVLLDSFDAWLLTVNEARESWGYAPLTAQAFRGHFGQGVEDDLREFYPDRTLEEIGAFYDAAFPKNAHLVKADPDAAGVLAALRDRGLAVAVITNTPTALARRMLEGAGLRLDVIVGSGDVEREKPAPDMALRACELLDVEPKETIVVGDSQFDRGAAKAVGATFVGLGIEGDFKIESLASLPGLLRGETAD